MEQNDHDIPPQYYQIGKIINDYKQTICQRFRSNEALLVQQLDVKAKKLKEQIAFYKKQTSAQNIEKLVSKKRHQKQVQRLDLQVHWRNLTEKYKRLQEQQKKINEENRQNKFDLDNLQKKILLLQQENSVVNQRITKLKDEVQSQPFVTEVEVSYKSPYKFCNTGQQLQINKKKIATFGNESANFRLKLDQKKKFIDVNKQNKVLPTNKNHQSRDTQKISEQNEGDCQIKQSSFEITNWYEFLETESQKKKKKFPLGKGDKWNQLMHYLNKKEVRDKIFDLLRK